MRAKEGWVGSARLPHPSKPLNFPFPTAQNRTRFKGSIFSSFPLLLLLLLAVSQRGTIFAFTRVPPSPTLRPFFPLLLWGVVPSFQFATHNTAAVKITNTTRYTPIDVAVLCTILLFPFLKGFDDVKSDRSHLLNNNTLILYAKPPPTHMPYTEMD